MQNHQVGMLGDKPLRRGGRAKRIVGKLNVGLVDHDHAGARIAQGRDKVERRHITRGIVGRGHDCQVALGAAASMAAWSSSKVAGSRHTSRTSVWQSDAKNAYSLKHGGQLSRVRPAPPNASR